MEDGSLAVVLGSLRVDGFVPNGDPQIKAGRNQRKMSFSWRVEVLFDEFWFPWKSLPPDHYTGSKL